uniref:Putative ovule protein n=1 Tax=Solanum chacoense TaxID=4108 RepID=A0A0V0IH78_SOLCH
MFTRNHFEFFLLAIRTPAFEKSFLINGLFSTASYFFCSSFFLKFLCSILQYFLEFQKNCKGLHVLLTLLDCSKALHNTTLFHCWELLFYAFGLSKVFALLSKSL